MILLPKMIINLQNRRTKRRNIIISMKTKTTITSQIIAQQLTNNIIRNIPKYMIMKKMQSQRGQKMLEQSLQYMQHKFQQINNVKEIKYFIPTEQQLTNREEGDFYFRQKSKVGRQSIITINKKQKQNSINGNSRRGSLKNIRHKYNVNLDVKNNFKRKLVKLETDSDEDSTYTQYIQKLRDKKIRLAEALGEFQQSENNVNSNNIENPTKINTNFHKSIITNYEGQALKSDRKNINNTKKQNTFWSQKNKIKPIYKLKQSMYTQKDIAKFPSQSDFLYSLTPSMKIQDLDSKSRQDKNNLNIKSIIDVYTMKNLQKSRRIFNVR